MIRIVNSLWRIVEVPPTDYNLMRNNGSFTLGCCNNYEKTIYVSNSLNYEKYKHVITHELCHAFIFELEIDIPTSEEERICNMIADYGETIFEMVDMLSDEIERVRA